MKKGRIGSVVSSAFLVAGGVFAFQVLISNVSAVTNRIDMSDSKSFDYINGIFNRNNQKDETDALFVGDYCIFSESGYFDYTVGENGYNDKDAKKVRINCDATVPGVSFDKTTRTLTLDGYTGNEKIRYFNTKTTKKDDLNIKVYGENKVDKLTILEYSDEDNVVDVNISGGGTLSTNAGVSIEGSLFKGNGENASYFQMFNASVKNVVINMPEVMKIKTSDGREVSTYPRLSISAHNLELENVKFSGRILSYNNSKVVVKNSDINLYDELSGSSFFNNDSISFENSDIKIENGFRAYGYKVGLLKIKNSNIEAKNTNDKVETSEDYSPSLYLTSSSPFPILVYKYLEKNDEEMTGEVLDRISLESVKVKDNLKVVSSRVVYKDTLHPELTNAYVASIFGTDETRYNEETEKWENYPRTVVITAEKPELVGAKIVGEKKGGALTEGGIIESEKKDILEGENQEMSADEIKDLVIRYNRDISLFEKVLFDGKELAEKDYTLKSGSTILTIKADYLKTQGTGEHKVATYFEGDEKPIETTVTLKASKTEDNKNVGTSNTGLYTVEKGDYSETSKTIFTVLAFGLIISGAILKIRNRNKKAIYRSR